MMGYFESYRIRKTSHSVRLLELAQECLEAGYVPVISTDTRGHITFMDVYRKGENNKVEILDMQVSELPYSFTFFGSASPEQRRIISFIDRRYDIDIDTPLTLETVERYFTTHYKSLEKIPVWSSRKLPTLDQLADGKSHMKRYTDGFVNEYAKSRGVTLPATINPFEYLKAPK